MICGVEEKADSSVGTEARACSGDIYIRMYLDTKIHTQPRTNTDYTLLLRSFKLAPRYPKTSSTLRACIIPISLQLTCIVTWAELYRPGVAGCLRILSILLCNFSTKMRTFVEIWNREI